MVMQRRNKECGERGKQVRPVAGAAAHKPPASLSASVKYKLASLPRGLAACEYKACACVLITMYSASIPCVGVVAATESLESHLQAGASAAVIAASAAAGNVTCTTQSNATAGLAWFAKKAASKALSEVLSMSSSLTVRAAARWACTLQRLHIKDSNVFRFLGRPGASSKTKVSGRQTVQCSSPLLAASGPIAEC
jgi:hypothetical protein